MEEEGDLDEVDSTTEIEIVLENLGEGGLVGVVAVVGGGRSESPMEEGTRRWHAVFGGGSDLGVLGTHLDKDDVYGGSTKLSPELRRRRSVDVVISFLRFL